MAMILCKRSFCIGAKIAQQSLSTASTVGCNTHLLSKDNLDFYNKHGYIIVKKLFDPKTLENFIKRFKEVVKNGEVNNKITVVKEHSLLGKYSDPEDYVNKIQDIFDDEVFKAYSEDERLLHIVTQFLGRDITGLNSMMLNKPPGTARHPAHQDLYYIPIRPANIVASWTAIDAATVENGCLFCVPGTHKMPLMEHHIFWQDSKKFFHKITEEDNFASENRRVHLTMDPGDTVFFHPLLIHGSGANASTGPRRAMAVHFMNTNCRYIDLEGTVQEPLIGEFQHKVLKERHLTTFQDFWKAKSKVLKGSGSNN